MVRSFFKYLISAIAFMVVTQQVTALKIQSEVDTTTISAYENNWCSNGSHIVKGIKNGNTCGSNG